MTRAPSGIVRAGVQLAHSRVALRESTSVAPSPISVDISRSFSSSTIASTAARALASAIPLRRSFPPSLVARPGCRPQPDGHEACHCRRRAWSRRRPEPARGASPKSACSSGRQAARIGHGTVGCSNRTRSRPPPGSQRVSRRVWRVECWRGRRPECVRIHLAVVTEGLTSTRGGSHACQLRSATCRESTGLDRDLKTGWRACRPVAPRVRIVEAEAYGGQASISPS